MKFTLNELKQKTLKDKINFVNECCSDDNILAQLSIELRTNIFFLLKKGSVDTDILGKYCNDFIFNDSLELLDVQKGCSNSINNLKIKIIKYYLQIISSINDYNTEMSEHLNDFYFNFFKTTNINDLSFIFNSVFYSQKQDKDNEQLRIINMNDTKHIKNSKYLYDCIMKNSKLITL